LLKVRSLGENFGESEMGRLMGGQMGMQRAEKGRLLSKVLVFHCMAWLLGLLPSRPAFTLSFMAKSEKPSH
jgi:hypothetical protein